MYHNLKRLGITELNHQYVCCILKFSAVHGDKNTRSKRESLKWKLYLTRPYRSWQFTEKVFLLQVHQHVVEDSGGPGPAAVKVTAQF